MIFKIELNLLSSKLPDSKLPDLILHSLIKEMARKKQEVQLQAEIDKQEDWDAFLQKPGLVGKSCI